MKTMGFDVTGDLIVVVHTGDAPTDADWEPYVDAVRELFRKSLDKSRIRNLVFTDGGAPNSGQRKLVNDIIGGTGVPAAIVSSSTLVRGVVTSLSWFNPSIKAFSPQAANEAYRHLGFNRDEIGVLRPRLEKLEQRVGAKINALSEALAADNSVVQNRR